MKIFIGIILCVSAVVLGFSPLEKQWSSAYFFYKYERTNEKTKIIEHLSNTEHDFLVYNKGNVLYEAFLESDFETDYLDEAITVFEGLLKKTEDEDTQYNYDALVELREKLQITQEEEKQEEEEKQQQDQQNSSQEQDDEEKEEKQEEEEQQKTQSQSTRSEEYRLDKQQAIDGLNEQEESQLEKRIEQLENQQKTNSNSYGKQSHRSDFQNLFDTLFNPATQGKEDW